MINERKLSKELWAVTNNKGEVHWTSGGSSTSPKIMVYATEKKAKAALRYAPERAEVRKIYETTIF